jgi:ABC-type protease/lipase transport system fused ATPase/permease subunit
MTDNQKLYSFFSMWITVCIVILWVFDPALWIKAVLGLNILGCLGIMRAVHNSATLPPDTDTDKDAKQVASQDDATCQMENVTTKDSTDMSEAVSDNSEKSNS